MELFCLPSRKEGQGPCSFSEHSTAAIRFAFTSEPGKGVNGATGDAVLNLDKAPAIFFF